MPKHYDAFICYNRKDKACVDVIVRRLIEDAKLTVWFDDRDLVAGCPFQEEMEQALAKSKCCVVFVGPSGIGPWQNEEMRLALEKVISRSIERVIPVLLSGVGLPHPENVLPSVLRRRAWIRIPEVGHDGEALGRLKNGILGAPPGKVTAWEVSDAFKLRCPFRGLLAFREKDSDLFFGREALTERLCSKVLDYPFLAVLGPSGSGKSSIVQAGMLPKLRDGRTLIAVFSPGERPVEELAFTLHGLCPDMGNSEDIFERLRRTKSALRFISRDYFGALKMRRLVIVVDQFEEIFTRCKDENQRRCFLALLLDAVALPNAGVIVIVTLRSDFIGRCAQYPDLNMWVIDHLAQIGAMSEDNLRCAVAEPARLVGLEFEKGLVAQIIEDAKFATGELPILEHALLELYNNRVGRHLSFKAYREIGGIQGALVKRAEAEFAKLDTNERKILRKMFVLCLILPGDGAEDTRRRATKEELITIGRPRKVAEALIERWASARLLTTRRERGLETVDVSHEALIRRWERIKDWMREDREKARSTQALRRAAADWQRESLNSDYLFQGVRLARVEEVFMNEPSLLTGLEERFIRASLAQREHERQRRLRRAQLSTAAVLLVLAVVGYLAFNWRDSESRSRRQLIRSYWEKAHEYREQDKILLFLHTIVEAVGLRPEDDTRENILRDAASYNPKWYLLHILNHNGPVKGAVFDNSETRVLTWSSDGTAQLWEASTGKRLIPAMRHEGGVEGAEFNTAATRIVTWSKSGTVRIWDTDSGRPISALLRQRGNVRGAQFNKEETRILTWGGNDVRLWAAEDGRPVGGRPRPLFFSVFGATFNKEGSRVLAWGSPRGSIKMWDAESGEPVDSAYEYSGAINGAMFNPSDTHFLTWNVSGELLLWDAQRVEPVSVPLELGQGLWGATFNADGSRILTWGFGGEVQLWDTETLKAIRRPFRHGGYVVGARFDSAEKRVLSWGYDGYVKLWDVMSGESIGRPLKHERAVNGAIFSFDETQVLSWSDDGAARVWDSQTGNPLSTALTHERRVVGSVFDSSSTRILTWGDDNMVRMWRSTDSEPTERNLEHRASVWGASFSANETRVLTWGLDGTRIWNAVNGQPIGPSRRPKLGANGRAGVRGASVNADETQILTWRRDGTVRLLDASNAEPIQAPIRHRYEVLGATFNPTEDLILSWQSESIFLWESSSGRQIGRPIKHQGRIAGATFNVNGTEILAWSVDGVVRIWSSSYSKPISRPMRHEDRVIGATFNSDESKILSWSDDGTARLWDTSTSKMIGAALKHEDGILGAAFDTEEARVLTWSRDGTARIWSVEKSSQLGKPFEHQKAVLGAMFDASENRVLTWSDDGTARLWDARSYEPAGALLRHRDSIQGATLNAVETQVLTWSKDGNVRLWDVGTSEPIGPPMKHGGWVEGADFDSSQDRILTWSLDQTARIWDISGDLDLPADVLELQVQALTGTEFVTSTRDIQCIAGERWRRIRDEYESRARRHSRFCKFPDNNYWLKNRSRDDKEGALSEVESDY